MNVHVYACEHLREIAAETRKLKARVRKEGRDPAEREARRVARQAQAALRKTASRGILATAIRGKGGWRVRLEVPLDDVPAIIGRTR